ncbi:MAG: hypothetical protein FWD43_00715 [Coriobacteriia bacterium]|nr:hypothetical protein [Coriobacteriia bacterium]
MTQKEHKVCDGRGVNLAAAVPHPPILVAGIGSAADLATAEATCSAYARIASEIVAARPELIVFATPHGSVYRDCFLLSSGAHAKGSWHSFGRDPERYQITYDEGFVAALANQARDASLPCLKRADPVLDHGVMVPLHFLLAAGLDVDSCKFARISISLLDEKTHYSLGRCVQQVAASLGLRTVFVASGDLSHRLKKSGSYGFAPEGPVFDEAMCQAFASGDFGRFFSFDESFRDKAAECGLNSFLIMAGLFDGYEVNTELYSYEGPWGVGYGVARFDRGNANETRARPCL